MDRPETMRPYVKRVSVNSQTSHHSSATRNLFTSITRPLGDLNNLEDQNGRKITKLNSSPTRRTSMKRLLHDPKEMERYIQRKTSKIDYSTYYSNKISCNIVDYLASKSIGNQRLQRSHLSKGYGMKHLIQHELFNERLYDLKQIDKIFCSQWLSDNEVIIGTKCKKLIVLDTKSGQYWPINTLKNFQENIYSPRKCGIHAIQLNPSKTLLATGADNPDDIAIYKLPTLDPLCISENAHKDCLFDFKWLDDEFLISGSKDSTILLWRIDESFNESFDSNIPKITPLSKKKVNNVDKIRALLYNDRNSEIVALSLNTQILLFDAQTLNKKFISKLPFHKDNACMAQNLDRGLYAIGSKSHITLLNHRTLEQVENIPSKFQGVGVRSLSFSEDILTIGTGHGNILFYDVRAKKYFETKTKTCALYTHEGWIDHDDEFESVYFDYAQYKPAIYTHCYNASGTKIFTAGGPLPTKVKGNYAALWK